MPVYEADQVTFDEAPAQGGTIHDPDKVVFDSPAPTPVAAAPAVPAPRPTGVMPPPPADTGAPSFGTDVIGKSVSDLVGLIPDVAHVAAQAVGGVGRGITLGAIDPTTGKVGIPFTAIKKQVVPPLAQSVDALTGRETVPSADPSLVQDVIDPVARAAGELFGAGGPWSKISKTVGGALGATSKALVPVGEVVPTRGEKLAAAARRLATQTATGSIVGGAFPREEGESLGKNVAVGAAFGLGGGLANEAIQGLARLSQNARNKALQKLARLTQNARNNALQKLAHDVSEFLYRDGQAKTPAEAERMAADVVLNTVKEANGDISYTNIKKAHAAVKEALSKTPPVEKPVSGTEVPPEGTPSPMGDAHVPDEGPGLIRQFNDIHAQETAAEEAARLKAEADKKAETPEPSKAAPLGQGSSELKLPPKPTDYVPDFASGLMGRMDAIRAEEDARTAQDEDRKAKEAEVYNQRPGRSTAAPLGQGERIDALDAERASLKDDKSPEAAKRTEEIIKEIKDLKSQDVGLMPDVNPGEGLPNRKLTREEYEKAPAIHEDDRINSIKRKTFGDMVASGNIAGAVKHVEEGLAAGKHPQILEEGVFNELNDLALKSEDPAVENYIEEAHGKVKAIFDEAKKKLPTPYVDEKGREMSPHEAAVQKMYTGPERRKQPRVADEMKAQKAKTEAEKPSGVMPRAEEPKAPEGPDAGVMPSPPAETMSEFLDRYIRPKTGENTQDFDITHMMRKDGIGRIASAVNQSPDDPVGYLRDYWKVDENTDDGKLKIAKIKLALDDVNISDAQRSTLASWVDSIFKKPTPKQIKPISQFPAAKEEVKATPPETTPKAPAQEETAPNSPPASAEPPGGPGGVGPDVSERESLAQKYAKKNADEMYNEADNTTTSGHRRWEPADAPASKSEAEKPADNPPGEAVGKGKGDLGTIDNINTVALSKHFEGTIADAAQKGTPLKQNQVLAKVGELYNMRPGEVRSKARMKHIEEAVEYAIVKRGREIMSENALSDADKYEAAKKVYDVQPNLAVRSSTSIANQQYSTPLPLSVLMDQWLDLDGKSDLTVYEPTAGNGMLVVGARPESVTVNELDKGPRLAHLEDTKYGTVLNEDALSVAEEHPDMGKSVDRVVANPPFGSAPEKKYDNFPMTKVEHQITAEALKSMKNDGKAAIIIGGENFKRGKKMTETDRLFFNWLYSHFNVVHNIDIDGGVYGRMGTKYPIRLLTIDGRKAEADQVYAPQSPEEVQSAKTLDEVRDVLATEGGIKNVEPTGKGNSVELPTEPGGVSGIPGGAVAGGKSGGGHKPGTGISKPRAGNDTAEVGDTGGRGGDDIRDSGGSGRPGAEDGRREPVERKPVGDTGDTGARPLGLENEFQEKYQPFSKGPRTDKLIPKNLVEPIKRALTRLEKEHGPVDNFLVKELGYKDMAALHKSFSAEQVDGVALALANFKKGGSMIIGDQMGVGKGRMAASFLRWANHNGHPLPIFFTEKPNLFSDLYRDAIAIDYEMKPFIMNGDPSKATILDAEGNVVFKPHGDGKLYNRLLGGDMHGQLKDYNAILTVYSQVNVPNKQRQILMGLSPNNIIVLDESHNAAGESNTGEFMKGLIEPARSVAYSSATYAKRADTMPIYYKTDLGTSGLAMDDLINAVKRGGVGLQQIIAHDLAEAGQYTRREMDFTGIEFKTKVLNKTRARDEVESDNSTRLLREILDFDKQLQAIIKGMHKAMKAEGKKQEKSLIGAGSVASGRKALQAGVSKATFSSKVHNVLSQLALGLKVDAVADEAIRLIQAGEKPIITLSNTMESFIKAHMDENGLDVGSPIEYGFGQVIKRALSGTLKYTEKTATGQPIKRELKVADLPLYLQTEYRRIEKMCNDMETSIPASPIDYITAKINLAGYTVGEITGRNLTIDYAGHLADKNNKPTIGKRLKQEKNRNKIAYKYNNGQTDVLIINAAGSTGMSVHAAPEFEDHRVRHMLFAQPALNIDTFIQATGRPNRTGQLAKPRYTYIQTDLPCEIRPAAVASRKMKSMNANTSADSESAMSLNVPDMMNQYGDQIVTKWLEDNPEENAMMGSPLDIHEMGDKIKNGKIVADVPDGAMQKVSGKVSLLPVADQRRFYSEIEPEYNNLIEYLNQQGENKLVSHDYDYQAKIQEKSKIYQGSNNNSPFTADTFLEKHQVKMLKKPYRAEKVATVVADTLDGKTAKDFNDDILKSIKDKLDKHEAMIGKPRKGRTTPSPEGVEHQKAQLDEDFQYIRAILTKFTIGDTYSIDSGLGGDGGGPNYYMTGVLTGIKVPQDIEGNPVAASKYSLVFAVTDPIQTFKMPFSKISQIHDTEFLDEGITSDWDEKLPKTAYETKHIITGNLLHGFDQADNGQVISFTTDKGERRQGILLPKNTKIDQTFKSQSVNAAKAIEHLMKTAPNASGATHVSTSNADVDMFYFPGKQAMKVTLPKSKMAGGRYFQNENLKDLTNKGEFESSGGKMVAFVQSEKVAPFLNILEKELGAKFMVPLNLDIQKFDENGNEVKSENESAPSGGGSRGTKPAEATAHPYEAEGGDTTVDMNAGLDAKKALDTVAKSDFVTDTGRWMRDIFAPYIGASSESKGAIYQMKGEVDKQSAMLRARPDIKRLGKAVRKWSEAQQAAFLDNVRAGKVDKLRGDERALYEIGQVLDAVMRVRLQEVFPDMPMRENHAMLTVKWRLPEDGSPFFAPKKLGGDKGFTKRYSGKSVSELMDAGLTPKTLNPVQIMLESFADRVKTVELANWLRDGIDTGRFKYVPDFEDAPGGHAKLNDKVTNVFKKLLFNDKIAGEEHVDKATYDGLMEVARGLGLEPERVVDAGRAKLGYASAARDVVTQHNTALSVLAHEIGHQLDFKYNLWEKIVSGQEGYGKRGEVTQAATRERRGKIQKELRDLADLYTEGTPPKDVAPYFKQKIRKKAEKMARMLEAYISAPEKFRKVAPTVFRIFDDFIKTTPELKKLSEIKPGIALQGIDYEHKVQPPLFLKSFDVLDADGATVAHFPFSEQAEAYAKSIGGKVEPHPVMPKHMRAGEWYLPQQEAAMLNNFISRDLIRATSLGRGLMDAKNMYTQIELGVSGFHGATIAQETLASRTGLIFQQLVNGDDEGLKHTLDPRNIISIPKLLKEYMADPKVADTPEFKQRLTAALGPKASGMADLVDAYFKGGSILTRDEGLKPKVLERIRRGEWGAVVRLPGEVVGKTTEYLFETIIPNAKFTQFALEYMHNINNVYAGRIKDGTMTVNDVQRLTARRVENRFGEMNWENFFLPRTVKTALQLMFRSPTWSYGTWANIAGAGPEQFTEIRNALREGRRPKLEGKMAWLFGVIVAHVAESVLIGYAMTYATGQDLRPKSFFDYAFPKISAVSRLRVPGYLNEPISLYESAKKGPFYMPTEYMKNKLQGMIGKASEIWHNKGYYGEQIWNPEDGIGQQVWDSATYFAPQPISVQSLRQALKEGETAGAVTSIFGFSKAPGYVNKTAAREVIDEVFRQHGQVGGRTKEEMAYSQTRGRAVNWLRHGKSVENMPQGMKDGLRKMTDRQIGNIIEDAAMTPLQASFKSNRITADDALRVWKKATPDERAELKPLFDKKIDNHYNNLVDQEDKAAFLRKVQEVMGE